ncbi:uncharacterized protein B0J16DRAFT_388818 [Fusarium flagelliforme]|uniref:uncharacterized protein n=1 Tax=Fusarium flagelliforme TaxID=2675880 RepID=UPI001E8E0C29|nr:uncharacterized protein B0J16DRAFT_388818 [Fusarium flagelliforme]KAH7174991.1 hypothetical protein B0J16DRAFT_388818 [Fusarium flagelliforme]
MSTIEISDLTVCQQHVLEVCDDCQVDGREDNDGFYGFDGLDRDAVELPPVTLNENGEYQCDKHQSESCSQCFCWKKKIGRARKEAKMASRG